MVCGSSNTPSMETRQTLPSPVSQYVRTLTQMECGNLFRSRNLSTLPGHELSIQGRLHLPYTLTLLALSRDLCVLAASRYSPDIICHEAKPALHSCLIQGLGTYPAFVVRCGSPPAVVAIPFPAGRILRCGRCMKTIWIPSRPTGRAPRHAS